MTATVGEPYNVSIMIAGVLPPAGAFSRWEILVDEEVTYRAEGIFFPTKRVYDAYITFNPQYWYEKTTTVEVPLGTPPGGMQEAQLRELMSQLDDNTAHAKITVRLSFYDSESDKWKVYASAGRTVGVQCPQCPPVTRPSPH